MGCPRRIVDDEERLEEIVATTRGSIELDRPESTAVVDRRSPDGGVRMPWCERQYEGPIVSRSARCSNAPHVKRTFPMQLELA